MVTFRRTQREKGRVMTTRSQEMANRSQPQTPMPPSLVLLSSGKMTNTNYHQSPANLLPPGSLLPAPFFMISQEMAEEEGYTRTDLTESLSRPGRHIQSWEILLSSEDWKSNQFKSLPQPLLLVLSSSLIFGKVFTSIWKLLSLYYERRNFWG